ncbi:MAG: RluA family pseudouridine synthase, partial [Acinetobacter pittii]
LQAGDIVRVPPLRLAERDEPEPLAQGLLERLEAAIVYEDKALIVLNKPAGIAVHGGSGLNYGVIEAFRQLRPDATDRELVHRLDRDTSGLVLISKKRSTLKLLQDLLREHKIQKTYAAIVNGQVSLDRQMIDAPLLRYEMANGERRVRVTSEGKPSKTDWKVVERFKTATLVHASPLSGRTHQIRVHGLSIGHPLLGDDKYGHTTEYAGPQARRLCLHAMRLDIPGYPPIEAPLPEDMTQLLKALRVAK